MIHEPTEPAAVDPPARPPPRDGKARRARFLLSLIYVRARFFLILGVLFVVVGRWDVLRAYWDRLTRGKSDAAAGAAVSGDKEYFCPMDPGVISDWPSKCSICNMALVPRKKGDMAPLPSGVLVRMQLSPERVVLAGIRTQRVDYRPLNVSALAAGTVTDRADGKTLAEASLPARHAALLRGLATADAVGEEGRDRLPDGPTATATADALAGLPPLTGRVTRFEPRVGAGHAIHLELEFSDPDQLLWPGMQITVRLARSVDDLDPFASMPAEAPPLREEEQRAVYVCPDHPVQLRDEPGTCPLDDNQLAQIELANHERLDWWCPMHPEATANASGHECQPCEGMRLLPRVTAYRPKGQVLAVPETAVIDTGDKQVVFLERTPGLFEGVQVVLGPRCGGWFPVVQGLAAGDRAASAGAFLLDAETRLNPSIAAAYFGAARSSAGTTVPARGAPSAVEDADGSIRAALAELSPADQDLAEQQRICPVTGLALGCMGAPLGIELGERRVLICCAGCERALRANPAKFLSKLP